MLNVIDVSYHNGKIDWKTVKGKIDGVIIRCGYGNNLAAQDDPQWKQNADECTRLQIPFGTYLYSYAQNDVQAKSEAEHVLRLVKGYRLSFPIYYDLEAPGIEDAAVRNAKIFGGIVEKAGYMAGIYANNDWFNRIIKDHLDQYTKWIARFSEKRPDQLCDMWQYTSTGSVPGIVGNVDRSRCYRDFPAELTGTVLPPQPESDANEIADEVIAGQWGNGDERKKRLEAAGYDYNAIQALVNEKLKKPVDAIAREVIAGQWGNGRERTSRIRAAGYDPTEVQQRVNALLGESGEAIQYYTIKYGDTLSEIAKKYGTTQQSLIQLNGIRHPDKIYAGQRIRIS